MVVIAWFAARGILLATANVNAEQARTFGCFALSLTLCGWFIFGGVDEAGRE
jgi:hypothetical protein